MTLEKIVNELEKREAVLTERETALRRKIYDCRYQKSFSDLCERRYKKSFFDLTEKELNQDWELIRALDRLEQPFRKRMGRIQAERSKIRNMLYEYRQSRG